VSLLPKILFQMLSLIPPDSSLIIIIGHGV
jgi:hypothetical protein